MMKKFSLLSVFVLVFLLTNACVYRLDIQQGNILTQKEVDKLRKDFTKSQVIFVLGSPTVKDNFSDHQWIYLYSYKDRNEDSYTSKKLVLNFKEDRLTSAEGDFEIPESLKNLNPR